MDGGAGNDAIEGDAGNEFIVGRTGADIIDTGTGADVIAFNQGDGQDTILASEGTDNTLSLGGGIQYVDLLFSTNGNDLVLATSASDQLTFKDWYSSTVNRSVANLQVVIEGSADYDASSSDPLRDNKIEQFDFAALVDKFDQARAATPALSQWALSAALAEFHLDGSDVAAIGGDLAYQYAKDGGLSSVSVGRAQALLAGTQFGTERETIAPEAGTYSLL